MIKKLKLLKDTSILAITIYPFIFVRDDNPSEELINHERIHLEQQKELFILPFFIWYGLEYLIRRIRGEGEWYSYFNLKFEQEAYNNENDLSYLETRKRYNYFKKNNKQ